MRGTRNNPLMRKMVEGTSLSPKDSVYPLFLVEGEGVKKEIPSLPGAYHFSPDQLDQEIKEIEDLGISGVILFGIPNHRDVHGSQAHAEDGIIQRRVRKIKSLHPNLLVVTDVCMCEYTDHGHRGILDGDGQIINDITTKYIAKAALSHVQTGTDTVAPSNTMDFRVRETCQLLDMSGYENTPIMTYSAKFVSSYYGLFRQAADSAPSSGDRKSYQMDSHDGQEVLREVVLDPDKDADFIIIKPALTYLDIVREVKESLNTVLVAYNVSGEYSMLKSATTQGLVDESTIYKSMIAMKRAGVQIIISYHAKEVAKKLREADL